MEIHWVHAGELSDQERENAVARVNALAAGHTDLIDVRFVARATGHHRHGDKEIRITCEARGTEIVAARTREDLSLALNDALDAFEREVRRMRERRDERRRERSSLPPNLGIVDRVLREQGYGFLLSDSGEQIYFHRNAVGGALAFDRLAEGDRVSFEYEAGDQGPQATVVLEPPADAPTP